MQGYLTKNIMRKFLKNPFVGLVLIMGAYFSLLLFIPVTSSVAVVAGAAPIALWGMGLYPVSGAAIGYFFWRLLQEK